MTYFDNDDENEAFDYLRLQDDFCSLDSRGYRDGYDRDGYDENGYDSRGYDADGFDRRGYDRDGYNRAGHSEDEVKEFLSEFDEDSLMETQRAAWRIERVKVIRELLTF